jgi:hypothetical protein
VASDEDARLYGEIGRKQKLFTGAQFDSACQAASGRHPGEVLLEGGVLSRGQHKGLIRAVAYTRGREEDKRIAQILVDNRYCEGTSVRKALKAQKEIYGKSGQLVRLGALLVDQGTLTASQHTAARKLYELGRKHPD